MYNMSEGPNSGFLFNSSRRARLAGPPVCTARTGPDLTCPLQVSLRRTVSGALYAGKSRLERGECDRPASNGVLHIIDTTL